MIVDSSSADIIYSSKFTGVHGNYLRPSIVNAGLDPDTLGNGDPSQMSFGSKDSGDAKVWKDIWGCGQGIGAITKVVPTAELVARLKAEYEAAKAIATQALEGYVDPDVGAATHYHADYVAPAWRRSMNEVTQVGQHVFYSWRGHAGEPRSLTQAYAGGELAVHEQAMAALTRMRRA